MDQRVHRVPVRGRAAPVLRAGDGADAGPGAGRGRAGRGQGARAGRGGDRFQRGRGVARGPAVCRLLRRGLAAGYAFVRARDACGLGAAAARCCGYVRRRGGGRAGCGCADHQRDRGGLSVAAAGVQPRGGRVPADAAAGAVVLGADLERGASCCGRCWPFSDRAGPAVLLRHAGVRPPRHPVPARHDRTGQAVRRLGFPGHGPRGARRADAAVDGAARSRAGRHHVAQLLPVPRHRSAEVILIP